MADSAPALAPIKKYTINHYRYNFFNTNPNFLTIKKIIFKYLFFN